MKLYACNISQLKFSDVKELYLKVSEERKKRIDRYKIEEDKVRGVISQSLIMKMLTQELNMDPSDIVIKKNEYGKPFIEDIDIYFNVSHSGHWVVGAIDKKPIGIDIEEIKERGYKKLAKRFFTEDENNYILEEDSLNRFFRIWTMKESYIKTDGRGMSIPLNTYSIKFDSELITVDTKNELKDCLFKEYNIDEKYKLSVCSVSKQFIENIKEITIDELL